MCLDELEKYFVFKEQSNDDMDLHAYCLLLRAYSLHSLDPSQQECVKEWVRVAQRLGSLDKINLVVDSEFASLKQFIENN